MAVTMAEISKLRKLTGAGMMDCKNALTETNGDIEAAKEIIRKKGQAVAAKREDREASEGCVLAAAKGDFAAIVALKCETDFVAKNDSFVALTKSILDAAIEAKATDLETVKALVVNGTPVANLIVDEIGKTGEKMELGYYEAILAPYTTAYIQSKGDPITDLSEDLAAEQKARTTYENLMRLAKDPEVYGPLLFLREREIVHFQRFGEALDFVRKDLDCRNYYRYNPAFDR